MTQEKIKIGAFIFTVITEKNLVREDRSESLDGHIKYATSEIKVDASLMPQARRATIWHEVIHGILTQAGYSKHDERMIEAISHGLMNVLQDNPWLAQPVEE
jgi:hypothetical protein